MTITSKGTAQVGIYKGLNAPEYFALEAVNASSLKALDKSLGHYLYGCMMGTKESDSMFLGTALHTAVLEPERFMQTFISRPPGLNLTRKDDKMVYADFKLSNSDKVIIEKEADWRFLLGACEASLSNQRLQDLLKSADVELSLVADINGVRCKGRIDIFNSPEVGDVKTTSRGYRTFVYDVTDYQYYLSAAMYFRLLKAHDLKAYRMSFIGVEKEEPYQIFFCELDSDSLARADKELMYRLDLIKKAEDEDSFPYYSQESSIIKLPKSYEMKHEQS